MLNSGTDAVNAWPGLTTDSSLNVSPAAGLPRFSNSTFLLETGIPLPIDEIAGQKTTHKQPESLMRR